MVFLKLYWGLLSIVFFSLYIKSFILLQRRKSLGFHPVNKVANATHQDGCSDIYTITRHPDTLLMVSKTLPVQCGGAPSCMNGYPRVFIPRAHLSTSLKTSALTGDAKKICLIISDPQKTGQIMTFCESDGLTLKIQNLKFPEPIILSVRLTRKLEIGFIREPYLLVV